MTEAVVADPQPERKVGFANRPYGNKKTVEEEEKELEQLKKDASDEQDKEEAREELRKEEDSLLETSAEERTFKKRYGDLRRFSQKQKEDFEERIVKLEQQLEESTKKHIQLPKTEDELNAWIKEYPDIAAVIETIAIKKADERSESVSKKLLEIEKMQTNARKEKAEAELIRLHPDFEDIRDQDEFHEWVETQPKWVQTALYDNEDDALSAARAIDLYKADNGLLKKKESKVDTRKQAASSVTTKSQKSTPREGGEDGAFYESQVQKMTADEYEKNADSIMEAIRTGNFVYDLSGGAR